MLPPMHHSSNPTKDTAVLKVVLLDLGPPYFHYRLHTKFAHVELCLKVVTDEGAGGTKLRW